MIFRYFPRGVEAFNGFFSPARWAPVVQDFDLSLFRASARQTAATLASVYA
jgi:hypothetical protein